ncbi:MAG: PPM-type phosphatase protein, partial [Thermoleophilia bacterium]|nr:PPM-type phosphatase protein [Thermoleophilia bacterium]
MRIGRAAGVTDTGRRRLRNEDAFICEPPLFAVADGMGGARAGEVAARLAAGALEEAGVETKGEQGVTAMIVEANRRIWERALADPATTGMGTTVTAALFDTDSGTVAIGHVGDSRAYLLRAGSLEQLTTDHSLVAELVSSGVLTPEEAERHPQRSAITRALGTEPIVDVEVLTIAGEPGDLYLICSDGLPTMLADSAVAAALEAAERDPAAAAEALVAAANRQGGEDNVTVVLFELAEGEPPAHEPAAIVPEPVADDPMQQEHEQEPEASPASLSLHGAGALEEAGVETKGEQGVTAMIVEANR